MSGEPVKRTAAPAFRLLTLGTLALRGTEAEASGPDHGQQGRRLAILAAVAAAGGRGRARDELLLFFWPDASQERARHSLEQALYLIRRSLGTTVFTGVNPLRLDPAVLSSDIAEFEAALEQGRLETAAELYRGPFLDGFYLSDAPEFEEWMHAERARLEGRYRGALERLAESAESADDHASAVRWWQRLAEVDPLSVRPALGVMRGLAAAGDHATALRHAQDYERLVERELGTGAGPEVAALAEAIRHRAKEAAVRPPSGPRELQTPGTRIEASPIVRADEEPTIAATPSAGWSGWRSRRRVAYGVVAALLVVAVFVVTRPGDEPTVPAAVEAVETSIVVLPLANLSPDPADGILADGMTEELIAMLAKVGDLRVISSTSAFAFRDAPADVRAIADSLRVAHVLEGGVRKDGSRIRVQIRLVDARDGSTRWSETYDREVEDLFAVQEDIARTVARELGVRLGGGAAAPTSRNRARNVAAYELYLRGSDPGLLRSDSGPHRALEYFRQAIAIDSTYAAAWAGLARMYIRVQSTEDPGMPIEDLRALNVQAALKAVALDDSLAEAHATLGMSRMHIDQDFATAESELRRAIELDPAYGRAREWLVGLYIETERPVEALAEARRALEVDPLSPSAHAELAHALLANDRPDEALVHLGHIAAVRPPLLRTRGYLIQAYAMKGMWPEAIETLGPPGEIEDSSGLSLRAYVLGKGSRREEALRIREELLERWEDGDARAVDVAIAYAGLGELDQAFAWIDRSTKDGLTGAHLSLTAPIFNDLRREPRFDRVRERLGIQKR